VPYYERELNTRTLTVDATIFPIQNSSKFHLLVELCLLFVELVIGEKLDSQIRQMKNITGVSQVRRI
jgi:hypothetical protein